MKTLPYDKTSSNSIENYALTLKEKTFKDVLLNDPNITNEDRAILFEYYNNPKSKGSLGQLIEKHFFFYEKRRCSGIYWTKWSRKNNNY